MAKDTLTASPLEKGLISAWVRSLKQSFYRPIAAELNRVARYYDQVIFWSKRPTDDGTLADLIECQSARECSDVSHLRIDSADLHSRALIVLNGNFNHSFDIQAELQGLRPFLARTSRIALVAYSPYWRVAYRLASLLGLKRGEMPITFLTTPDLENLAEISGYQICRTRPAVYWPIPLLGIESLVNRVISVIPFLNRFAFTEVIFLRPRLMTKVTPSLSVVIPARNERGNIGPAIERLKSWDRCPLEVIFVEGNSTDGTWEEIQAQVAAYSGPITMKTAKQPGRGKNDAVRLGFSLAKNDLLTILDADLSMPPELLHRFYDAYADGYGDFINGSRLLYPMEGEAMRFLNWVGNKFFTRLLSFVLDTRVTDVLCGTKLLSRSDYRRLERWRQDFGDFDPFGDFELLFAASSMALGVVDIPIRYLARTYGATNISRWRHGAMLLRMSLIGLFRIKAGR